jgi:hypothetical protein
MEFIGQIKKILPAREGVSQRTGNQWKTQPFVFEYFENKTDRYADSVVLETFDTNVMSQLKEFAKVRIGFGHHTREHEGRVYNEVSMYKFELVDDGAAAQPQPTVNQGQGASPQPTANQQQEQQQGGGESDDLPF